MRVGIIGAGLAGLSAGLELADRGHEVELLERRPWAGGSTYSFSDDETGDEVDNGQHVFMQCTTAYVAFLERIGTLGLTHRQDWLHVPVFDEDGRRSDLGAANLPLGLHLAPALLRYRHLTWRQKAQIVRAFLALRLMRRAERARLDGMTFEEWLRSHGQSPETIREFWDFLVIPTLNCRAEESSASQALFVIEEGFQRDPGAAALGVAGVGLSTLHVDPAVRAIEKRGGTLTTRAPIERIEVDDGRVAALVLRGGEQRSFDAYVSALAPWRLRGLLPDEVRGEGAFADLASFEPASILNVHLWFDRPVADFAFAAFIRSEVQWVFNRSRAGGEDETRRQHLVVSISAPGELFELNREALRDRLLPQLHHALPASREAKLAHYTVVKEPEATFVPAPGLRRPGPRTPLANLYLAGAYTDTGWPATMESAVRSGLAAAAAVEESSG
ncbi:MAG: FAD-dependent oxidoreductase [Chloroflexi bacterium]|nr:FAD-dependent oxidoreductase [Chloroflexota bacterium]